ncbi:MAG: hypothetical protein SGI96_21250 [Bacteroidota bacterium]|nr:hypothetical protein [Bacteroidota bacterium]
MENIFFFFWNLKAIVVGYFRYKEIMKGPQIMKTTVGACMPNGDGDFEKANKMGAAFYRFGINEAKKVKNISSMSGPYALLMDGVSDKEYLALAERIRDAWNTLKIKPEIILCSNENNHISYTTPKNVRAILNNTIHVPIVKGPFRCAVESDARKKYYRLLKNKSELDSPRLPEVFNYYEKPHWEGNKRENLRRRCVFTYIVTELRKYGITTFYVTEFHDGTKEKVIVIPKKELRPFTINTEGSKDGDEIVQDYGVVYAVKRHEGDFVFASKDGIESILNFFGRLEIRAAMYYCAPFIGRNGNTVA